MEERNSILTWVGFFLLLALSFVFGLRCGVKLFTEQDVERVDTLYVCDTITQYEPIYKEIHKVEKVLVPVVDTMRVTDTLYVYLEREQVVWKDSVSCVYASGIMPSVDSVRHYISERIVEREKVNYVKKQCRWGLGVHAGYGLMMGSQIQTSPYIGIGLSYNILTW